VAYYSTYTNPLTYSGRRAVPGATVAVDPSVIPLGSIVYVTSLDGTSWSYGPADAADIGGGIKGTYIDLFMGSYAECVAHGNRVCRIYIITPAN
jgi:3D (Asp-Asp-Asp) domain-containing protein